MCIAIGCDGKQKKHVVENVDPEFLKSKIKDCDGASIRTAKLTGDVIEAANNLKIIEFNKISTI